MEASSRPQELVSAELLEVGTRSPVVPINGGLTMNSELFVQELAHVHGLYGKMKESVFPSAEQSASSVQLIRKDLVLEMRRTVVDFYQWQCKKVRNGRFPEHVHFPPSCAFLCGCDETPSCLSGKRRRGGRRWRGNIPAAGGEEHCATEHDVLLSLVLKQRPVSAFSVHQTGRSSGLHQV